MCTVFIYYVYINIYTYSIYFENIYMWVKDVKMYKNDFMSIESTLNVSKVSTFKVLNVFGE